MRTIVKVATVLVLAGATSGQGATHLVPEEYSTIQAAIDVAVAGDSVLVGPGTYTGQDQTGQVCANWLTQHVVADLKPGLFLIGTAGPEVTILDGGPVDPYGVRTLRLVSQVGPPTRIEGFTITGGKVGAAVGCTNSNSAVTFVDCHFVDNPNMGLNCALATVVVEDCLFRNNGEAGNLLVQGAIGVSTNADVAILRTRFEDNGSGGLTTIGDPTRIVIDDCEFVDHKEERAIRVKRCPDVQIRNSLFLRNRTLASNATGAGIRFEGSSGIVEFCTFAYDSTMNANGAAIKVASSSSNVTIRNNTFFRCYSGGVGGALSWGGSSGSVYGNVIVECSAGALAQSAGSLTDSGCNILWGNASNYFQWPTEAMATDIEADPLLCDPENLDLTVEEGSPATSPPAPCSPIGAYGVGCGAVSVGSGVETSTWGRIKNSFRPQGDGGW